MLNQKHTREVMLAATGHDSKFQSTRELLLESAEYLRNGGQHELGLIHAASDVQLVEVLDRHDAELASVFANADALLQTDANTSDERQAKLLEDLVTQTQVSHEAAHAVVQTLARLNSEYAATTNKQ